MGDGTKEYTKIALSRGMRQPGVGGIFKRQAFEEGLKKGLSPEAQAYQAAEGGDTTEALAAAENSTSLNLQEKAEILARAYEVRASQGSDPQDVSDIKIAKALREKSSGKK